jgi:hypothetical protein
MHLTKAERETIILFSEADSTATVYTFNTKLKNKLGKLSESHPGKVKLISQDKMGSVTYSIPKNLITVRTPVSEKQKQLARSNAQKYGFGEKIKGEHPNNSDENNDGVVITHFIL